MDFLEGIWFSIRFSSFVLQLNIRGCVSLKKEKSQANAVEVNVNSKAENS
jgi:hypothetical protein